MGGCPGAGKTEFSKSFTSYWNKQNQNHKIARIDPDEVRETLPNYRHEDSETFQGATALGIEKLIDFVLHNNQNFLLDGTFSNYKVSSTNISRSIKKGRSVIVIYIYQDPVVAWEFTQKRAVVEERIVPKQAFVRSFFNSMENIKIAKKEFGNRIQIELIIKNFQEDKETTFSDIYDIDKYIKFEYNEEELLKILL